MKNKNINLKEHLFLFDIDGTILDSHGSGKKAFITSFEKILNTKIDSDIDFLGGIDNIVFKDLYFKKKFPENSIDDYWNKFKKTYIKILSSAEFNDNWNIFPNVEYTIKLLKDISNIALVTGNIKEGARIKLQKVNLDKFFSCGAFGDSIINRTLLVKEAINTSQNKFNKTFKSCNIYLFGDTEKDVQSAVENDIIPILIDHKKRYKDVLKNIPVKHYIDFSQIDALLELIANP